MQKQNKLISADKARYVLVQAPEMRYPAGYRVILEIPFSSGIPIAISSPKLTTVPLKASSRLLVKSRRGRQSFHGTLSSGYLQSY